MLFQRMNQIRWTIYCHTHIKSGRHYIGLTKMGMTVRWNRHVYSALHSKDGRWHFPNAIRKYGKEAFSHEVLEICNTLEEGNTAEIKWIDHFDSRNPEKGFNLMKGGEHVPHPIKKNPWDDPEYREKQIKRFKDPSWKKLMNGPSTKIKMSLASKGRKNKNPWNDPEYREKNLPRVIARNTNQDVRIRISKALTGRKLSSDHIKKTKNTKSILPRKTHCKYGHSLNDAIVYKNSRNCLSCRKIRNEKRKNDISYKDKVKIYKEKQKTKPGFKEWQKQYNKVYHDKIKKVKKGDL